MKNNSDTPKPASTFPYGDYAPDKLKEAADRAMDHYLKPDDSDPAPPTLGAVVQRIGQR